VPGYKGHLVGGAAAFGVGLYALQSSYTPTHFTVFEWFLCTLAGALFPDIDVKSKGQNLFYKGMLIVLVALFAQGYLHLAVLIGILSLIPMIVRHRGLFHRLWFVIALPFFVTFCVSKYYPAYSHILFVDTTFFVLGAVSHLWLDLGLRRMLRL
jgi:LexA-binding, inner membrane-associated putative hydrolase